MSLFAMPFLVMNFGGEMIYILEQRLHAQKIPPEKAQKVLQDVSRAMFSDKFIAELLKPQPIYTYPATREIFDRLAHSSIMRLSESSMDKLYDLMTMGFKYQLVSCTHPRELTDVTLNHIESIKQAIAGGSEVVKAIENALTQVTRLCKELTTAEFAQIRQALTAFLQDKRIKVSLFLQDQIQNPDGTIVLPKGGPLPADTLVDAPGRIKYFGGNGSESGSDKFNYPLGATAGARLGGDPFDPASRDSKLGRNLYTIDRSGRAAPKPAAAAKPAAAPTASTTSTKVKDAGSAVSRELQGLATMIGVAKTPDKLSINLFPDAADDGAGPAQREIVISKVDAEEIRKNNQDLLKIADSMNVGGDGGKQKDLLALMDDAELQ
jgi:hypothetical protein